MNQIEAIVIAAGLAIAAVIIVIAISVRHAARAHKSGYRQGLADSQQRHDKQIELINGVIERRQASMNKLERYKEELEEHAEHLQTLTAEKQAENTELQKEVDRLQRAIALLQTAPPFPEYISLRDLTTIEQMAEKLRIAAPALHATQQFAASKEADRLANSAKRLADKLRPALIAAAAPVTPAQDAAA